MASPTKLGAFIALLPGLQTHGLLMPCIGSAMRLARLSPRIVSAGDDWISLLGGMAKDGSLMPAIDDIETLAKSLATLMADPGQQPLVMAFLKTFDKES